MTVRQEKTMKKFTLATLALAMGTALIAAPQGTEKSKAPATTTDTKGGEKGKASKKGKTKGEKNKGEKDKGTKLHEHTN